MPEISIIVPVYNVESYLARCLDSILTQSFSDFELILVDDGSTDGSGEICDSYAGGDERIIVIHRENGGVSAARNTGIRAAGGKYITFCDSDDYWKKEWLDTLHSAVSSSGADLVNAGYSIIDENGSFLGEVGYKKQMFQIDTPARKTEFITAMLMKGGFGWEACTKLFSRSIIDDHQIFFCETCENFAEDLGFVLEYLLYCRSIISCEGNYYCYVQRETSMMHITKNDVKLNAVNEISFHFGKRFLSIGDDPDQNKKLAVIHFMIMYNQYTRIIAKDSYPFLAREIKKIRNRSWYIKETAAAFPAYRYFCAALGKPAAQKIMLLSAYCLHRNWKLHTWLSAFFYKYIYSGE
jgi:glycosyltransferase involved in cell wall biosynthesis